MTAALRYGKIWSGTEPRRSDQKRKEIFAPCEKTIMTKQLNMRVCRRALCLFCALLCLVPFVSFRTSAYDDIPIYIDGELLLGGQARLVDSITYVPFRAFADAMGADHVLWEASTRTAAAKVGSVTVSAKQGQRYLIANGRYLYGVGEVINLYGTLYVPVRPMAKALSLSLTWNGASRSVSLARTGSRLQDGASFYRSDEVYWLSRIIHAEAGAEPFLGKIAVGNVVMNRVRSPLYPNTIYGVIFDRRYGTQFSPVSFGTIYNTPSADSVIAAKLVLDGAVISNEVLFFMNPRIATSNWISQNRPYAFTIGRHDFYY